MNNIYDRPAEGGVRPPDISFFADNQPGSGIPEAGMGIIENYGDDSARYNSPEQNGASARHGNSNGSANGSGNSNGNAQDSEQSESLAQKLSDNIGLFVVCEFFTGSLGVRQGILSEVGLDYIVLYDDIQGFYTICDLYSLKFATFYNSRVTPRNFRSRR